MKRTTKGFWRAPSGLYLPVGKLAGGANPQTPPTSSSEPGWQPGVQDGAHTPGPIFPEGVPAGNTANQVPVFNGTTYVAQVLGRAQLVEAWTEVAPESAKLTVVKTCFIRKILGLGSPEAGSAALELRGELSVKAAETLAAGEKILKALPFAVAITQKFSVVTGTAAAMVANRLTVNVSGETTLDAAVAAEGTIPLNGIIIFVGT